MSFSPPRTAFEWVPRIGWLATQFTAGWTPVAGRTFSIGFINTASFGDPASTVYLGTTLDAVNAAPGAGQVQLTSPAFNLEPGHTYEARVRYNDTNAPDFRWKGTVYTGANAGTSAFTFPIIGEAGSAGIEIVSRAAVNYRPFICGLVVVRTSV